VLAIICEARWGPAAPLTDAQVAELVEQLARRITRCFERQGRLPRAHTQDADQPDEHDASRFDQLCAASIQGGAALAPDGRVIYCLKQHWRDGTSAVSFDPLTFIERLAARADPRRPPSRCRRSRLTDRARHIDPPARDSGPASDSRGAWLRPRCRTLAPKIRGGSMTQLRDESGQA
jgi:hypothetical protein